MLCVVFCVLCCPISCILYVDEILCSLPWMKEVQSTNDDHYHHLQPGLMMALGVHAPWILLLDYEVDCKVGL